MGLRQFALLSIVSVIAVGNTSAQDKVAPQSSEATRVCIATVANASTTSVFVERLTDRLTANLKQDKVNAVAIKSRATNKYPLQMSNQIREESKKNECDYVLLTQIRDQRQHPFEPQAPQISIGGRVPSVDASDSASHGPVYRENLQVAFALFRIDRFNPVLDTYVLERPSASVSDTLLPAMDREANRVRDELRQSNSGDIPE